MKKVLGKLFEHQTLTRAEAREVLLGIAESRYSREHLVSFLTVYLMREITVDELSGFREALLDLCVPVDLSGFDTIDVCGTGGDHKNTFNISTLSAFVLAGAGIRVSKHGNYGVSSVSGSSNVLEYLGVRFTKDPDRLKQQLDKANICFLHAPLFHPALRQVSEIRKALGFKTFFNILGPLVNPAKPGKQFTGVFSLSLARLYSYLLQQENKSFSLVYSLDTYDEVSLTGPFKLITQSSERIYTPGDFGLAKQSPEDIYGGDSIKEAARIFTDILTGNGTAAQNNVVLMNAALAISCYYPGLSIPDSLELAKDSLYSGRACKQFNLLKSLN